MRPRIAAIAATLLLAGAVGGAVALVVSGDDSDSAPTVTQPAVTDESSESGAGAATDEAVTNRDGDEPMTEEESAPLEESEPDAYDGPTIQTQPFDPDGFGDGADGGFDIQDPRE